MWPEPGSTDWMIPPAVVLSCRECGAVWIQTAGQAMANPLAPIVCPECRSLTPLTPPDAPLVVFGEAD